MTSDGPHGLDVEDLDERASLSDNSSSSGRAELADAEPEFYDPDADERNKRWVARLRAGSGTDAILSCPQCFTTLCVECEQHATRDNQFRARHVLNCRIDTESVQVHRAGGGHGQAQKRRLQDAGSEADPSTKGSLQDKFNPVSCAVCDLEVGVRSLEDGTFHFTTVFASAG